MSERFAVTPTPLAGLLLLQRLKRTDDRGYLTRLFCPDELGALGWDGPVAQVNETGTRAKGTVRGMHFQHSPYSEMKLVTCLAGAVLDIAVDLRRGSPTFLAHYAAELSDENACSLMIPKGFAHGFQTLTDDVRMIYVHSAPFHPEAEGGLSCQDPALGIDWPLPVAHLSARDAAHPFIASDYEGIA